MCVYGHPTHFWTAVYAFRYIFMYIYVGGRVHQSPGLVTQEEVQHRRIYIYIYFSYVQKDMQRICHIDIAYSLRD